MSYDCKIRIETTEEGFPSATERSSDTFKDALDALLRAHMDAMPGGATTVIEALAYCICETDVDAIADLLSEKHHQLIDAANKLVNPNRASAGVGA